MSSFLQRVTWVLGPGWVPDCEAQHTPASGAEIKNAWNETAAPPCIFIAWGLIKLNENFIPFC